ncbi:MAG: S-layer family protein, partial [Cyanothece sp. SIO2G6]|nr:S-layer family protein [Cyanothece sp. SIO2G6]
LQVNDPIAGLESWLPQSGRIQNQSTLQVGGDLSLVASALDLQGRIVAGENISLIATDELMVSDRPTHPAILSADNQLLLQGNQSLDISALAHPLSGLSAGGDLILRSDAAIVGDAAFQAGGNLTIERLDGRLGRLISVDDPVFQTAGDFAVASYEGASLQILAGGSVTIPEGITIDAAGGPFNDSTVELSNGASLGINGSTEPTVDIRAGTTEFFGTVGSGNPTSADISVGPIFNPGGLVYLTNQFQPNADLTGDIAASLIVTADGSGGGDVVLDSRGEITFNVIDTSGGALSDIADLGIIDALPGRAGDVTLLAANDIFMPFVPPASRTVIFAFGTEGGDITLASDIAIIQESAPFGTDPFTLSQIESLSVGAGSNGDVSLSAPFISIGGNVQTTAFGRSTSGDIVITAETFNADQATILADTFGPGNSGDVVVDAGAIALDFTLLGTSSTSDSGGRSGDVVLRTGSLTGTRGAQIGSLAFLVGDAGDVDVTADIISLSGFQPGNLSNGIFAASSIFSSVESGAEGNSGDVRISTRNLEILGGAQITTSSLGIGNAGQVIVNAEDAIRIDGAVFTAFDNRSHPSSITSEILVGADGTGGDIRIRTGTLDVSNGGTLTTASRGTGDAGSIRIDARESVTFDEIQTFEGRELRRISQAAVFVGDESTGNAGDLTVVTPSLSLTNGGQLTAEAQGVGIGGNITVRGQTLVLDQGNILAETASNTGGDITLQIANVMAMAAGSQVSATAGTSQAGGNGGNILIDTRFLVAEPNGNNDITANAFEGSGGRVDITAEGIFGLIPRSRSELESLLGTTDPTQLDPANLSTNNITAISQTNANLNGEVVIRSPDVDPSQDVTELPSGIVDASRLITQGCTATGTTLAQTVGSLIVTGRGGLPQTPGESLSQQDLALSWETLDQVGARRNEEEVAIARSPAQSPHALVEVQALTRQADGRVILTAEGPRGSHHIPISGAGSCVSPSP